MNKKLKKILGLALFLLVVVGLSGCVRYDAAGNPTGTVYEYLGKPATNFIAWIANLFNGSYGVSIIVITIITRLFMLPSSLKMTYDSTISQAKTKYAQPEIDDIQAEIEEADTEEERLALQNEIMAIYKKYGINQFSGCATGCLPLLVQMPIISAVYAALNSSQAIRESTFLGIHLGERSWIMVILVFVVYLIQGWLTKQSMPDTGTSNNAASQQTNMMLWMNPIMLAWFTYSSAAGMGLYFLVGGIFAIVQQLVSNQVVKPKAESKAAIEIAKYEDIPKRKRKTKVKKNKSTANSGRLVPTKQAVKDEKGQRNSGRQNRK